MLYQLLKCRLFNGTTTLVIKVSNNWKYKEIKWMDKNNRRDSKMLKEQK